MAIITRSKIEHPHDKASVVRYNTRAGRSTLARKHIQSIFGKLRKGKTKKSKEMLTDSKNRDGGQNRDTSVGGEVPDTSEPRHPSINDNTYVDRQQDHRSQRDYQEDLQRISSGESRLEARQHSTNELNSTHSQTEYERDHVFGSGNMGRLSQRESRTKIRGQSSGASVKGWREESVNNDDSEEEPTRESRRYSRPKSQRQSMQGSYKPVHYSLRDSHERDDFDGERLRASAGMDPRQSSRPQSRYQTSSRSYRNGDDQSGDSNSDDEHDRSSRRATQFSRRHKSSARSYGHGIEDRYTGEFDLVEEPQGVSIRESRVPSRRIGGGMSFRGNERETSFQEETAPQSVPESNREMPFLPPWLFYPPPPPFMLPPPPLQDPPSSGLSPTDAQLWGNPRYVRSGRNVSWAHTNPDCRPQDGSNIGTARWQLHGPSSPPQTTCCPPECPPPCCRSISPVFRRLQPPRECNQDRNIMPPCCICECRRQGRLPVNKKPRQCDQDRNMLTCWICECCRQGRLPVNNQPNCCNTSKDNPPFTRLSPILKHCAQVKQFDSCCKCKRSGFQTKVPKKDRKLKYQCITGCACESSFCGAAEHEETNRCHQKNTVFQSETIRGVRIILRTSKKRHKSAKNDRRSSFHDDSETAPVCLCCETDTSVQGMTDTEVDLCPSRSADEGDALFKSSSSYNGPNRHRDPRPVGSIPSPRQNDVQGKPCVQQRVACRDDQISNKVPALSSDVMDRVTQTSKSGNFAYGVDKTDKVCLENPESFHTHAQTTLSCLRDKSYDNLKTQRSRISIRLYEDTISKQECSHQSFPTTQNMSNDYNRSSWRRSDENLSIATLGQDTNSKAQDPFADPTVPGIEENLHRQEIVEINMSNKRFAAIDTHSSESVSQLPSRTVSPLPWNVAYGNHAQRLRHSYLSKDDARISTRICKKKMSRNKVGEEECPGINRESAEGTHDVSESNECSSRKIMPFKIFPPIFDHKEQNNEMKNSVIAQPWGTNYILKHSVHLPSLHTEAHRHGCGSNDTHILVDECSHFNLEKALFKSIFGDIKETHVNTSSDIFSDVLKALSFVRPCHMSSEDAKEHLSSMTLPKQACLLSKIFVQYRYKFLNKKCDANLLAVNKSGNRKLSDTNSERECDILYTDKNDNGMESSSQIYWEENATERGEDEDSQDVYYHSPLDICGQPVCSQDENGSEDDETDDIYFERIDSCMSGCYESEPCMACGNTEIYSESESEHSKGRIEARMFRESNDGKSSELTETEEEENSQLVCHKNIINQTIPCDKREPCKGATEAHNSSTISIGNKVCNNEVGKSKPGVSPDHMPGNNPSDVSLSVSVSTNTKLQHVTNGSLCTDLELEDENKGSSGLDSRLSLSDTSQEDISDAVSLIREPSTQRLTASICHPTERSSSLVCHDKTPDPTTKSPPSVCHDKSPDPTTQSSPSVYHDKTPDPRTKSPPSVCHDKSPDPTTQSSPSVCHDKTPDHRTKSPPSVCHDKSPDPTTQSPPSVCHDKTPDPRTKSPPSVCHDKTPYLSQRSLESVCHKEISHPTDDGSRCQFGGRGSAHHNPIFGPTQGRRGVESQHSPDAIYKGYSQDIKKQWKGTRNTRLYPGLKSCCREGHDDPIKRRSHAHCPFEEKTSIAKSPRALEKEGLPNLRKEMEIFAREIELKYKEIRQKATDAQDEQNVKQCPCTSCKSVNGDNDENKNTTDKQCVPRNSGNRHEYRSRCASIHKENEVPRVERPEQSKNNQCCDTTHDAHRHCVSGYGLSTHADDETDEESGGGAGNCVDWIFCDEWKEGRKNHCDAKGYQSFEESRKQTPEAAISQQESKYYSCELEGNHDARDNSDNDKEMVCCDFEDKGYCCIQRNGNGGSKRYKTRNTDISRHGKDARTAKETQNDWAEASQTLDGADEEEMNISGSMCSKRKKNVGSLCIDQGGHGYCCMPMKDKVCDRRKYICREIKSSDESQDRHKYCDSERHHKNNTTRNTDKASKHQSQRKSVGKCCNESELGESNLLSNAYSDEYENIKSTKSVSTAVDMTDDSCENQIHNSPNLSPTDSFCKGLRNIRGKIFSLEFKQHRNSFLEFENRVFRQSVGSLMAERCMLKENNKKCTPSSESDRSLCALRPSGKTHCNGHQLLNSCFNEKNCYRSKTKNSTDQIERSSGSVYDCHNFGWSPRRHKTGSKAVPINSSLHDTKLPAADRFTRHKSSRESLSDLSCSSFLQNDILHNKNPASYGESTGKASPTVKSLFDIICEKQQNVRSNMLYSSRMLSRANMWSYARCYMASLKSGSHVKDNKADGN